MKLYSRWCRSKRRQSKKKTLFTLTEKSGGRDVVRPDLIVTLRSHYERLDAIAEDVRTLGYAAASAILKQALPQTTTGRSGDLGEILATEFVEEDVGYRVPVRRLRYKDGRDMAMRGDDFIGVSPDLRDDQLSLLKGEAKSYRVLGTAAVTKGRAALKRDSGRCTPASLLFVANRLLESKHNGDQLLGRRLRNEVGLKQLRADRIAHMLFTVSGNGPHQTLLDDFESVKGTRKQYVVNLHIPDHQEFIAALYAEAEKLGRS